MKRLIIDLDNTLTIGEDSDYKNAKPRWDVINKLIKYKKIGFEIVIHTSRNMRTYEGNLGKIVAHTSPIIIEWLEKNSVPYDEIWLGKPWCGNQGFYVDDKSIRPDEFSSMNYEEIAKLLHLDIEK